MNIRKTMGAGALSLASLVGGESCVAPHKVYISKSEENPEFLEYNNPELGFKINYPSDWKHMGKEVNGDYTSVFFAPPSTRTGRTGVLTDLIKVLAAGPYVPFVAGVEVWNRPLEEQISQEVLDEQNKDPLMLVTTSGMLEANLSQWYDDLNILESDETMLSGLPAYRTVLRGKIKKGEQRTRRMEDIEMDMMYTSVPTTDKYYSVRCLGQPEEYDKYIDTVEEEFVRSFEILKSNKDTE